MGTQPYKEPHRWTVAGDNRTASVQARHLKIVGQEKGGSLLFAYDGYSPTAVRVSRPDRSHRPVQRCRAAHADAPGCYERGVAPGWREQASGKVTFIELFELTTRRRTRLYTHIERINVTNASINVDRTLLCRPRSQVPFRGLAHCSSRRWTARAHWPAWQSTVITTCTRHKAAAWNDEILESQFDGSSPTPRAGHT